MTLHKTPECLLAVGIECKIHFTICIYTEIFAEIIYVSGIIV